MEGKPELIGSPVGSGEHGEQFMGGWVADRDRGKGEVADRERWMRLQTDEWVRLQTDVHTC